MTLTELRQQAKARKIPQYYKLNKAQLMHALGVSEKTGGKSSNHHETTKTARAIATAIAKKTGVDKDFVEAHLKSSIKSALQKKRAQLKKAGKEATPADLRAAAIEAVKQVAQTHLGAKIADRHLASHTGAKQPSAYQQIMPHEARALKVLKTIGHADRVRSDSPHLDAYRSLQQKGLVKITSTGKGKQQIHTVELSRLGQKRLTRGAA